jgi:hypothetical protein
MERGLKNSDRSDSAGVEPQGKRHNVLQGPWVHELIHVSNSVSSASLPSSEKHDFFHDYYFH